MTKYGRYETIAEPQRVDGRLHVTCRCECGTVRTVRLRSLTNGLTRSCGCLNAEETAARNFKHGLSKTREWQLWNGMLNRCRPNAAEADRRLYFDRGIAVCERWTFYPNFLQDMGPRPPGASI